MKKITTLLLIAAAVFTMSCNNETKETAAEKTTEVAKVEAGVLESKNYIVSNSESVITWTGNKTIGDSHTGTVNVIAGKFDVVDGAIKQGKLSIDMTSISSTDLEGDKKGKLDGHLKNEDFFNVTEFPMASLEITDASDMKNVKANLTVRGVTEEISFPMSVSVSEGVATVSSDLEFDRTKFGVNYNSGNIFKDLGDKIISDMIKMNVKLIAK